MPSNTKLLQAMADTMLPLFGDMPRVLVVVKDHAEFHVERAPLAVYASPDIVVNPAHPPTSSFNELKSTICHELIHAWLDLKGLDQAGEFLDTHHNEWFVKKALEINRMNIDGLNVSVEFLLTTPEAINIYNRVAGTSRFPREPEEKREVKAPFDTKTQLLGTFGLGKKDKESLILIFFVLVMAAALVFNNTVTGYVWIACALAALIWPGFEAWKEIRSRRLSGKSIYQKRVKSEVASQSEVVKRDEE